MAKGHCFISPVDVQEWTCYTKAFLLVPSYQKTMGLVFVCFIKETQIEHIQGDMVSTPPIRIVVLIRDRKQEQRVLL